MSNPGPSAEDRISKLEAEVKELKTQSMAYNLLIQTLRLRFRLIDSDLTTLYKNDPPTAEQR